MALIVDPDLLAQNVEVIIDTTAKTVALVLAGDLTTDGVTLKCLYSFLKEEWKDDATLIKFPFPMTPITDESFELKDGWNFLNATTRQLIRTGGWTVKNVAGLTTEVWAGIITLGSLGGTDQVYYQQVSGGVSTNIVLTGAVNQAVQILKDDDGDGIFAEAADYDRRTFLKLFVREWSKTYASAALTDIGVTENMANQVYRFPLANGADLKVTETETNVPLSAPYTNINITYLVGHTFAVATAKAYTLNEVGKDTAGRWFRCSVAGTLDAAGVANYTLEGGTGTFVAFEGERQIGTLYYAFNKIVDADVSNSVTNPLVEDIYEKVQWSLRQATDIDAGAGTVTGKTADALLSFVGDTLVTATGVYVDDFHSNDTNRITFFDVGAASRIFPFVATLTINFGDNLVNDASAKYRIFFTNDDAGANAGNDYGSAGAITVNDAAAAAMAGLVSSSTSVTHTFNYDSNLQRGAGSSAVNAPITAVAIGLSTGQFVSATGTITRSTSNSISLVAPLERNYVNP